MKQVRSPLPFQVNVWTTGRYTLEDKFGMQICEMNPTHLNQGTMKGNAEYLNAAANLLPEMVKALKLHMEFLDSLPEGWLGHTTGDAGLLNDALCLTPNLLSRAKKALGQK